MHPQPAEVFPILIHRIVQHAVRMSHHLGHCRFESLQDAMTVQYMVVPCSFIESDIAMPTVANDPDDCIAGAHQSSGPKRDRIA